MITINLFYIIVIIIIILLIILNKIIQIRTDRINLIHGAIQGLNIIQNIKNDNEKNNKITSTYNIKDGKNHYIVKLYTKEKLSISEIEIIKDCLKYLEENQIMQSFVGNSIKLGKTEFTFKKEKFTIW